MPRSLRPLLCLVLCSSPLAAQGLTGYGSQAAAREGKLEALLVTLGDTARARSHSRTLGSSPHVAGTPAQQRTAQYVLEQMQSFGLDTSRADYQVYIPYPESTVVELVAPSPMRLGLDELPVPGDSSSQGSIWPVMNGHAAPGDATAPVVYANYGLPDDYRLLDSLGVSVRGKVVIARYGRSFRGIKAREAEARGAAALLLYSDPQDDGYVPGDVYPDGPMRPAQGVQRGSIFNGVGDPGSPGWASVAGARRLPVSEMAIPRIPVVPIGYGNAALLLQPLDGPAVPRSWQGGLPFHYHVGGGATVARVALWREPDSRGWKKITNTIAVLRGTEWPDEMVIVGGHRDAWGPGAVDNVSGVVSILEAARMLGEAARRGLRPRRTIVFATWDAEEWGLMGSTEWVEEREAELAAHAVAYLNLDVSVGGSGAFGASATGSLAPLLRELSRLVNQPYDSVPVYSAWRRLRHVADTADVMLGDLGGGSDFAGFYNHLGIPSAGFGFGGEGGVYHSAYDSYDWMRRFGDPGYQAHVAAGTIAALFLARMANADLVPFDYRAFAGHLSRTVGKVERAQRERGTPLELAPLAEALRLVDAAGGRWAEARDAALERGVAKPALTAANARLRGVEQALTRKEGLAGRPWMRNLVFASDRDNGYADVAFPSVQEPWRDGDRTATEREVTALAGMIRAAAERLDQATAALAPATH